MKLNWPKLSTRQARQPSFCMQSRVSGSNLQTCYKHITIVFVYPWPPDPSETAILSLAIEMLGFSAKVGGYWGGGQILQFSSFLNCSNNTRIFPNLDPKQSFDEVLWHQSLERKREKETNLETWKSPSSPTTAFVWLMKDWQKSRFICLGTLWWKNLSHGNQTPERMGIPKTTRPINFT